MKQQYLTPRAGRQAWVEGAILANALLSGRSAAHPSGEREGAGEEGMRYLARIATVSSLNNI